MQDANDNTWQTIHDSTGSLALLPNEPNILVSNLFTTTLMLFFKGRDCIENMIDNNRNIDKYFKYRNV